MPNAPFQKVASTSSIWFRAAKSISETVLGHSLSSNESQAILFSVWVSFFASPRKLSNHSVTNVDLPNPAGAEIRVSLRCNPMFNSVIRRGRDTRSGRVGGIKSLVVRSCSTFILVVRGHWTKKPTQHWFMNKSLI